MNGRTIEPSRHPWSRGTFDVYEWGTYPRSSVLAGQTRKTFLDNFPTREEAKAAYPDAEETGYIDPHNTFDHLPDEEGTLAEAIHDPEDRE